MQDAVVTVVANRALRPAEVTLVGDLGLRDEADADDVILAFLEYLYLKVVDLLAEGRSSGRHRIRATNSATEYKASTLTANSSSPNALAKTNASFDSRGAAPNPNPAAGGAALAGPQVTPSSFTSIWRAFLESHALRPRRGGQG
jgi:hypothetical protein